MSSFDFAAARAARPGYDTASLTRTLGNLLGPGSQESVAQRGAIIPSPAWERDNIVLVPIGDLPGWPSYDGQPVRGVRVHKAVAPVLIATWAEVVRRGLAGKLRTYDGAYMPRHMLWDPRKPLSVHSWGDAIDFDARWNGYGLAAGRIQIDRDVIRVFQEAGWQWGGLWSPSDGMHVQWTTALPGVPRPAWQDTLGTSATPPATVRPIPVLSAPASPLARVTLRDSAGRVVQMADKQTVYGGVVVTRKADGSVLLERA